MSNFRGPARMHTGLSPGTPESDCESSETEIYKFSLATPTVTNNISELSKSSSQEGLIETASFDTGMYGTGDCPSTLTSLSVKITAPAPPLVPPRRTVKQKLEDIRARSLLLRLAVKEIEKRFLEEKKFQFSFDHGKTNAETIHEKQLRKGLRELKLVTQIRDESKARDLSRVALECSSGFKLDTTSVKKSAVLRSSSLPIDKPLPASNSHTLPEGSSSLGKASSLSGSSPESAGFVTNVDSRAIDIHGKGSQVIHENVNADLGQLGVSLPVGQNVGAGASSKAGTDKEPVSRSVPPHLRYLDTTRTTTPFEKEAIVSHPQVHVGPTPLPPTISKVFHTIPKPTAEIPKSARRPPNPLAPTMIDGTGFKLPENPHIGGYDQRTVLKDPAQKVDVSGLKFTAWPEAVNRGNRIAQEKRAVIIDVPLTPTLSIISMMCKNTGKLESISIDPIKSKAIVTFIEARNADQFWRRAMKPLDFVAANDEQAIPSKQQISVRMDWPVDQLPRKVQNRLWAESASRMIFLDGWEKKNLEKIVGKRGETDTPIEILFERLAENYVPGGAQGRVEKVTWKDKGWGFFEGNILYAGIVEAMAAFDALKVELEFKGCEIKFGIDPCEPPVTVQW